MSHHMELMTGVMTPTHVNPHQSAPSATSSATSSSYSHCTPTDNDPHHCQHGARIVLTTGAGPTPPPTTTAAVKNALRQQTRAKRINGKKQLKQAKQKKQCKNKLKRQRQVCRRRQAGAISPTSPKHRRPIKISRAQSFRGHITHVATSISHLRKLKDKKTQGIQHGGIRHLINQYKQGITPSAPDGFFLKTLTYDCEDLYHNTIDNLENLYIRNALKGMDKAMAHYHGPSAVEDMTFALSRARTRGVKLHPLTSRLVRLLLHKHIMAHRNNNPALTQPSKLRPLIDFQGTPMGTPLSDVTHDIIRMAHSIADNDTPYWIIHQADLPMSHIYIPLPTMRMSDGPPFQEFPQAYTYTGHYPPAPVLTIFNVLHSLNIHKEHPPRSFPKKRLRNIGTDHPRDVLGLNTLI